MSELSSTAPCLSLAQGTSDFCSAPDTFILNVTEGQIRTGNEPSEPLLSEPLRVLGPGPQPATRFSPVVPPTVPQPPHLSFEGGGEPLGHLLEAPPWGVWGLAWPLRRVRARSLERSRPTPIPLPCRGDPLLPILQSEWKQPLPAGTPAQPGHHPAHSLLCTPGPSTDQ